MLLPLQDDCSLCSVLEDFLSTAYSAFSLSPLVRWMSSHPNLFVHMALLFCFKVCACLSFFFFLVLAKCPLLHQVKMNSSSVVSATSCSCGSHTMKLIIPLFQSYLEHIVFYFFLPLDYQQLQVSI